jgi:hypothetical protein
MLFIVSNHDDDDDDNAQRKPNKSIDDMKFKIRIGIIRLVVV